MAKPGRSSRPAAAAIQSMVLNGLKVVLLTLLMVVASCSSGAGRDLPDDTVLSSPHFRYHARSDATLDPTIMERLERRRTEFNDRFGVTDGVIDYYLFRDQADWARNSGCPWDADACEDHRSVFTPEPFMEHELVHAFMSDTGSPSNPVVEGIAQWEACVHPNTAAVVSWPLALTSDDKAYYSLGQRLVGWMMAQGDTPKFVDYYRTDTKTDDPVALSARFQAFWGQSIEAIAPSLNRAEYSGSSCECQAAEIPKDGTAEPFVAGQDYRVLKIAEDSLVELSVETGRFVVPLDCSGANDFEFAVLGPMAKRPALTVARLSAGTYEVATSPDASGTVTVGERQQPFEVPNCDAAAAAPVAVGDRDVTIWIDRKSRSAPTALGLKLEGPKVISVLEYAGDVSVCYDSCSTGCMMLAEGSFNYALTPSATGLVVLTLGPGSADHEAIVNIRSARP